MNAPSVPPAASPPPDDPRDTLRVVGFSLGPVLLIIATIAYFSIIRIEAGGGR